MENDVVAIYTVCPYCMNQTTWLKFSCCGESYTHFEKAVETKYGEIYLKYEVEIVKEKPNG